MSTLTTVLAIMVALEHIYILFLETIATSSESTSRVFGISIDQLKSKTIATLLKNQGVYNGLISVLLLIAVWQQDLLGDNL
jgi:putative membrane protein